MDSISLGKFLYWNCLFHFDLTYIDNIYQGIQSCLSFMGNAILEYLLRIF